MIKMMQKDVIPIYKNQMIDHEFLFETIKKYEIDELALTFFSMQIYEDKYDDYLFDKSKVYGFNAPTCDILNVIKTKKACVGVAQNRDDIDSSYYSFIADLKKNINEYIWVYSLFNDKNSRDSYLRTILFLLTNEIKYFYPVSLPMQYFCDDVLSIRKNPVYVDCGAYDGDSVINFIQNYTNKYQQIIAYEPTDETYKKLEESTKQYNNITLRKCGVGDKNEILYINEGKSYPGSGNYISKDNMGNQIEIVSLDKDIDQPISIIKMDVEGSEIAALKGAKEHIINDKPQLAISAYHLIGDLWKIPKIIYEYNNKQKFYFRKHIDYTPFEYVFYADPL